MRQGALVHPAGDPPVSLEHVAQGGRTPAMAQAGNRGGGRLSKTGQGALCAPAFTRCTRHRLRVKAFAAEAAPTENHIPRRSGFSREILWASQAAEPYLPDLIDVHARVRTRSIFCGSG